MHVCSLFCPLYCTDVLLCARKKRYAIATSAKMVFLPPKAFGELGTVPDHIPVSEFMLNEQYGRVPHSHSRDPYTCGLTGKSYSSHEVANRTDLLARALAKEFGWSPNKGTEWDKALAVFSINTVGPARRRASCAVELKLMTLSGARLIRCLCTGQFIDWEAL